MAKIKEAESAEVELKFPKEQILKAKRFSDFRDYLNGNLADDRMYSIDEVDSILSKVYEGKVI